MLDTLRSHVLMLQKSGACAGAHKWILVTQVWVLMGDGGLILPHHEMDQALQCPGVFAGVPPSPLATTINTHSPNHHLA